MGSALIGAVLTWIYHLWLTKQQSNQNVATQHAADAAQSAQDTQKLQQVTPTTSAGDVDAAADDALKHL